ncbi:MAG: hypothetical protein NXI30_12620 [bacterium]|nr:hypothetical protein [bacterium]
MFEFGDNDPGGRPYTEDDRFSNLRAQGSGSSVSRRDPDGDGDVEYYLRTTSPAASRTFSWLRIGRRDEGPFNANSVDIELLETGSVGEVYIRSDRGGDLSITTIGSIDFNSVVDVGDTRLWDSISWVQFGFEHPAPGSAGIAFDRLDVTWVPEPSPAALMLVGLALLSGVRAATSEPSAPSGRFRTNTTGLELKNFQQAPGENGRGND